MDAGKWIFFLHIFLLFVAFTKGKGLDVTAEHSTTDIGHGAFDEWFKYFHREISIALSAVGKSNVSNSCKSHLFSYLYDLESDKPWAVQMWDSMDALPAGILQGNVFFWPGSLDECLQIVEMKPQYCLTRMSINSTRSQNLQFLFLSNSAVSIGICLPAVCSAQEISNFLYAYLAPSALVTSITCQNSSPEYLDSSAIAIIIILTAFAILLILGTLWEVVPRFLGHTEENSTDDYEVTLYNCKNLCRSGLISFSAFANGSVLFSTDQREGIGSLHGLRFLSMAWIILLHTFSTSLVQSWNNLFEVLNLKNSFLAQIILNGNIAVDTFYCMSGLLVSYVFFKKITKTKEFSFVEYYLHRYVRITPVYAIIIGIVAGLLPFFGSGPRWPDVVQMSRNCKDNWWLNLLYVSNIFRQPTMCEPHCWFLATDIQLYIFAPVILYPLYKNKYIGGAIAAIVVLGCTLADALVTYFYDLPATAIVFEADSLQKQNEYSQRVYVQAYARGGPYVIGIITGFLLSKINEAPVFLNKKVALVGWLAATVCNLSVLFGFYTFISNSTVPSMVERCLYSALSRTAWATGIAWIVLACKWGYGGPVNSILSWKVFITLGKLTYCAYILHYNMLIMFYTSRQSTFYYDIWILIFIYFGILILSYTLAVPFCLLFELPILKLEKLVLNHKPKQSILNENQKNYASTNILDFSEPTNGMKGITNTGFEG